MMPDEIWHQTLPSGAPGHPVRSVFGNKIEFIHKHFRASDGKYIIFDGKLKMVPTIVPSQEDDGRCGS